MALDSFTVLAEPTRRRILDRLRSSDSTVGELVEALAVSQPTTSKHLRVLRDAGFVSCRTAAQRRIYRIETGPFESLAEWLEPYRRLWSHHLDALERHLDDGPPRRPSPRRRSSLKRRDEFRVAERSKVLTASNLPSS